MIKQIRTSYFSNFKNSQYCALSTDVIPSYLDNGDEVYFIDTGKVYYWDSFTSSLIEKKQVNGVPDGGIQGQFLGKTGPDDGDFGWQTLASGISSISFQIDDNGILDVIANNV